jgi:hypothetical protein
MASERKGRGRPPKPAKALKRNHYGFRTRDELARALEKSAARNKRSVSEEVEFWLEEWNRLREFLSGAVDASDVQRFAQTVAIIKSELEANGLSSRNWPRFISAFSAADPMGEAFDERIRHATRCAIDATFLEAERLLPKPFTEPGWKSGDLVEDFFHRKSLWNIVNELSRSGKLNEIAARARQSQNRRL